MTLSRPLSALVLAWAWAAIAPDTALAADPGFTQLIVSVAPDWDSGTGRLQLFERGPEGWHAVSSPARVIYGRNGLAWGRGEKIGEGGGPKKVEHDRRAPAGLFAIGKIYTYDRTLPPGADYPYHTITPADAWIDDPTLPDYNRHVTIDPANPPPWFAKQKMRLDDPPHRWLIEIRHNSDPPVPGAGSAIFFHIQRSPETPSSGCTVMPEGDLLRMITWLRASAHPHYVLLPRQEYLALWKKWGLPSPGEAEALLHP